MSLVFCPECGHEISNSAVACPQCGRPINARPVVERNVFVRQDPPASDAFPTWIFIPLGVLVIVVLAGIFYIFSRPDDSANTNVRITTVNGRPAEVARTT